MYITFHVWDVQIKLLKPVWICYVDTLMVGQFYFL